MQIILLIQFLLSTVRAASSYGSLIDLFHDQERFRWGQFYPSLVPDRIRAVPFIEIGSTVQLVEITGWPFGSFDVTLHFDGSPIETETDSQVINQHLDRLLNARFRHLTFFAVLDGWVSTNFLDEIGKRGYIQTEKMSIMTLDDLNLYHDAPVDALPEGLEVRLIDQLADFEKLIAYRPPPVQYFYRGFSLDAIRNPQMHSWGIFDSYTNECVCTTQVFVHDPRAAIVGMVSTAESWRGRGLATHLLATALQHAVKTCNIRRAMLQATPMAVNMYKRMGFETIATTTKCEYSFSAELNKSCIIF